MAKPDSDLTVMSSLVDRLIDRDPSDGFDPTVTRAQSVRNLKKSVLRDIEWLLNTRRIAEEARPEKMPYLAPSLYNYGLPEFSSLNVNSPRDRNQLLLELKSAISAFEPRLLNVRVTLLESSNRLEHVINFQIEGMLDMDPVPEMVAYDTSLRLSSGEYQIKDESSA